jgi:hypothetical protein
MPRVALRSRSHERCEGAVTSDRDVCRDDISNQMLDDSAFDRAPRGGGHNSREEPPRHASIFERDELAQLLLVPATTAANDAARVSVARTGTRRA